MDIKVNGAVHKGMPHKFYHGKTGRVWNVTKRAIGVELLKQVRGGAGAALGAHLHVQNAGRWSVCCPPAAASCMMLHVGGHAVRVHACAWQGSLECGGAQRRRRRRLGAGSGCWQRLELAAWAAVRKKGSSRSSAAVGLAALQLPALAGAAACWRVPCGRGQQTRSGSSTAGAT